jgi:flagellar basal-body rod protein FlgC
MISSIGISLSSLDAAHTRVSVAARNVANVQSTGHSSQNGSNSQPYQPQRVVQTSLEQGGTRADVVPVEPATVSVRSPGHPDADENGTVQFPNVSLEGEGIEMKQASQVYRASLAVLETENEMFGELLDTVS